MTFYTTRMKLTHNRVSVAVLIFIYQPTKSISIKWGYWVGRGGGRVREGVSK